MVRRAAVGACVVLLLCTLGAAAKKEKKAAAVGADGEATAASDVLVLTEANFEAEFKKGPMLVEFYAPVCSRPLSCAAVAPS